MKTAQDWFNMAILVNFAIVAVRLAIIERKLARRKP